MNNKDKIKHNTQGIIICMFAIIVLFIFCIVLAIMMERNKAALENVPKWECYNQTVLTHKFHVRENTFFSIKPIDIDIDKNFNGEMYFIEDSFYRVGLREVCEIV